jgi:hypothetical protein
VWCSDLRRGTAGLRYAGKTLIQSKRSPSAFQSTKPEK